MNEKYIKIALKRADYKHPKIKNIEEEMDVKIRKYITENKKTNTNYIFRQSRKNPEANFQDWLMNDLGDVLGFVDDFDENYMYCSIIKEFEYMFKNPEVWSASTVLITEDDESEKVKIKHVIRIECVL